VAVTDYALLGTLFGLVWFAAIAGWAVWAARRHS
jgi:hypothetical protein